MVQVWYEGAEIVRADNFWKLDKAENIQEEQINASWQANK